MTTHSNKSGMNPDRLNYISDYLQQQVDSGALAGVNTLIARNHEIAHTFQYGYQNREAKQPITDDTLYRIYSMTKPIIAVALMTLFEKGKFDLHDPVANYIPAFAAAKVLEVDADGKEHLVEPKTPMTIHHLLTHTSGLTYHFDYETPVAAMYRQAELFDNAAAYSLKDFVEEIAKLPLAYHPGERYSYSVSMDVVGYLIEVIADQPLQDFLQQHIFTPLGMHHTSFFVPEDQRAHVATVYGGMDILTKEASWSNMQAVWSKGEMMALDVDASDPVDNPQYARGGHGLKSTMGDYYKFCQMLLNKGHLNDCDILSPKTIELMSSVNMKAHLFPINWQEFVLDGYAFGLGFGVLYKWVDAQILGSDGEFGWSGAAKTTFWVDPKENLIAIFMAQSMNDFSNMHTIFHNLVYQAIQ